MLRIISKKLEKHKLLKKKKKYLQKLEWHSIEKETYMAINIWKDAYPN